MTAWISRVAAVVTLALFAAPLALAATTESKPPAAPGLGDPGQLTAVQIDSGRSVEGAFTLDGQDARQQLIVTGAYSSGQLRDLTGDVQYQAAPEGIVDVQPSGLIIPRADGKVTITAKSKQGPTGSITVNVVHFNNDPLVNFPNQIVPIFTKLGCNSGGCHGKASGQNGFKLSLLGFEPTEDYEHLVKEGRGRRLFPAAPDKSLLLLKPIGEVPHGGGTRLEADSHSYRLMRRWILQGMPYGSDSDPTVARIEVLPAERTMPQHGSQQLLVIAHYTNGATEDVTGTVKFEPNNPEMAEVSATGLVKTLDLSGDVAIMARYQGQVGVFRASVPLGVPVESTPPPKNFIDELVFKKLKTLGVPPSAVCDDATFLRRSAIDIAGRLPTPEETQKFFADTNPAKRDAWIDTLLASTDYADFFANKWNAILRNKRRDQTYARGTRIFHDWIRDSLHANVPFDQMARQLLTATGEIGQNPPVAWYREVKQTNEQVEDTAQLFLGLRIQCARCHHHPFEKWSQQDYYGFAAFFSRLERKPGAQFGEERVVYSRGTPSATNPKTQKSVAPTGLGAAPASISTDDDPRQALVDWMTSADNKFFAPALVNRYWKHFFSRGIVDPEDDMRVTNPATNQELLDGLAKSFIASKFDLKQLVRTICTSQVYQLASTPNDYNANDKQNFSRYYPKRLPAEVLLDAIDTVTQSKTGFTGIPQSVRAVQLPDSSFNSYFLTVFGRPDSTSACECERSSEANLAQSLHLLNSSEVQGKLSDANGRAALLAADKAQSREQKIRDIYLRAYSREPQGDEVAVAVAHLSKAKDEKLAFEDILWALVNTKEFLFNH
ncbi:MAG TPA: DUF1549 domain-containing protein [Pirellulales bacterium]|jgi:hypothetical protein|nr:DUF1549 domain-containing protein [Pirellulales bacterium]